MIEYDASRPISVGWDSGWPVLVVQDVGVLTELAEVVERVHAGRVYRGQAPVLGGPEFVIRARQVAAIASLVSPGQPKVEAVPSGAGRWVSVAQAAQRLGVTEQAVTKRARRGSLPARKVSRCWLIDMEGLR